jgi:hypothetical protein
MTNQSRFINGMNSMTTANLGAFQQSFQSIDTAVALAGGGTQLELDRIFGQPENYPMRWGRDDFCESQAGCADWAQMRPIGGVIMTVPGNPSLHVITIRGQRSQGQMQQWQTLAVH